MRRLLVPFLAAALLAGCGLFTKSAATVNGSVITEGELQQEVGWLQSVPEYQQAALSGLKLDQQDRAKLDSQVVALELNRLVAFRIVDQEFGRRHLGLTDGDRQQALTDTVDQITAVLGDPDRAVEVFNSLPVSFRLALIDRQAKTTVLQNSLPQGQPTDDQLRAFFEANKDRFERVCARYILSRTQTASEGALARVQRGEDFAAVARDVSADSNAKNTGGDVGCFGRGGVEKVFADTAFGLQPGQIAGPVEASVGWYLIQVYDRKDEAFEESKTDVAQQYAAAGPAIEFQSLIQQLLAQAKVSINPRYGRWDGQQRKVVPPGA